MARPKQVKVQVPLSLSEESPLDCRFARLVEPQKSLVDQFRRDFLTEHLYSTLIAYGCGQFEIDTHVDWFWKSSIAWRATTYPEFVVLARKKLSDHLGYTERRRDAETTISRLFDKAIFMPVTLTEAVDAVVLLVPTQPMPNQTFETDRHAIVDVSWGTDSQLRLLKIDRDFLPTLRRLYPWRLERGEIVKDIPGKAEPFDVSQLAFWHNHADTNRDELRFGRVFLNGDPLDWTRANLRSEWRLNAEQHQTGVPAEFKEYPGPGGSTRMFNRNHISLPDWLNNRGLADPSDLPAKPKAVPIRSDAAKITTVDGKRMAEDITFNDAGIPLKKK
jgi:hypothetical protein